VLVGAVGTAAMTLAMNAMFKRLPREERYPLPPSEITEATAQAVGVNHRLYESTRVALTVVLHFAYGSTVGALYYPLMAHLRWPVLLKGSMFGLGVWTGSYLGWVPLSGLLSPASDHPMRRNVLMIVAHFVWGTTIAGLTHVVVPDKPAWERCVLNVG
jgi:putative membrane protein